MRWLRVTAFLLLMAGAVAHGETGRWVPVQSSTTNSLASIHFASESEGWIVGDQATVLRSTDSGQSWKPYTQITTNPANCCFAVRFVTPAIGWIGGVRIVSKISSGKASTITYGVQSELRFDLFSASTDVAWVAAGEEVSPGNTEKFLYRVDPNKTPSQFKIRFLGSSGSYRSLFFIDANTGIAVGTGGRITRLTNALDSNPGTLGLVSNTSADLLGVFMLNSTTAWAIGSGGTILKTPDGTRWTPQFSGTTNRLNEIYFKDANQGLVVGDAGIILSTADGGNSWNIEPSGVPDDLRSVYYGTSAAWAVGANGTILKRVVTPPKRRAARP